MRVGLLTVAGRANSRAVVQDELLGDLASGVEDHRVSPREILLLAAPAVADLMVVPDGQVRDRAHHPLERREAPVRAIHPAVRGPKLVADLRRRGEIRSAVELVDEVRRLRAVRIGRITETPDDMRGELLDAVFDPVEGRGHLGVERRCARLVGLVRLVTRPYGEPMRGLATIVLQREGPLEGGVCLVEERADGRSPSTLDAPRTGKARGTGRLVGSLDLRSLEAQGARPANESPRPLAERSKRPRHGHEHGRGRSLSGPDLDIDPQHQPKLERMRRPREH